MGMREKGEMLKKMKDNKRNNIKSIGNISCN